MARSRAYERSLHAGREPCRSGLLAPPGLTRCSDLDERPLEPSYPVARNAAPSVLGRSAQRAPTSQPPLPRPMLWPRPARRHPPAPDRVVARIVPRASHWGPSGRHLPVRRCAHRSDAARYGRLPPSYRRHGTMASPSSSAARGRTPRAAANLAALEPARWLAALAERAIRRERSEMEPGGGPHAAATSTVGVGVIRSSRIVDVTVGLGLLAQAAVNQSVFCRPRVSTRSSSDVRQLVNQSG
jgi:hypothetical protein